MYKAFNWGNGEAVAVKQIKLADLPKSELRMIEVGRQRAIHIPNCAIRSLHVRVLFRVKSIFSRIFM